MINAYEYGKALFELATEQSLAEELMVELDAVTELIMGNPEYVTLLDTPAIPAGEKPGLIDEAFASCHAYVRDYIKILSAAKAVSQIGECAAQYRRCLDESQGIVRAEAVTAVPMTLSQCERLQKKLSGMTGKRVILINRVDSAVIGGVTLQCDSTRFDGSIRAKLEQLKRQLSGAHI